MFSIALARIKSWERAWKASFSTDISTPEGRRSARLHNNLVDHAFLRRFLPNRYQLSPEAWRSNQPDPVHFPALKKIGIKSVLNLRGASEKSYYLFEQEACADYAMTLHDFELSANTPSTPEKYLELLDLLERIEKPMLIHCKSGADRTGIVSAFYILDQLDGDFARARSQLSIKYAHQPWSRAGVLGHLLDTYGDHIRRDAIPLRQWLSEHYDQQAIIASFNAKRARA